MFSRQCHGLIPLLLLGFGWVNASYVYGLTIVNTHMKRALGTCTPWETFRKATEASEGA